MANHVKHSLQQETWDTYKDFKGNYESIIIEDPKEETESKLKAYAEKVDEVFKTLKQGMVHQLLSDYEGLEGEVTSCVLLDKVCMVGLIYKLQRIENNSNYSALKISYHLGLLFSKLKKTYRSVKRLMAALKLEVSRQYIQDKISLFALLEQYPRLQTCKVSPNYLKIKRRLIIEELPYRPDCEFWTTKIENQ